MARTGGDDAAARMVEAARRLVDIMARKAGPRVSEAYRGPPRGLRYGLDHTAHAQARSAAGLDRLDTTAPAERDTDTCRRRSAISAAEARELLRQVQDLEPDAAGTVNRVNRVETTAGPAVVRRSVDQPPATMLKRWMTETAAIAHARASGVRTPRNLYSGTDPATSREFTIIQYIPGETLSYSDPRVMSSLPDRLDQAQLMAAHPPTGRNAPRHSAVAAADDPTRR